MKYFSLIFLIVSMHQLQAQSEDFCNEALWYQKLQHGDTLSVRCDTVYLLNRFTFNYYQKLLKTYRSQDQRIKALTSVYDDMSMLYEKRVADQDKEYQQLLANFNQLVSGSNTFIQQSNQNLASIKTSLQHAEANIQTTQTSLATVESNLKQEIKISRKQKFKNIVGGFAAGAIVAALVFAASN